VSTNTLEATDWDSLGFWYVYVLLYPVHEVEHGADMLDIASAWNGDRVLFVRDVERDAHGFVWTSAWQDAHAAAGLERALRRLYGVAPDAIEATAFDGEAVRFERRENQLVVVKNVESDLAEALVAASLDEGGVTGAARRRPSLARWLDADSLGW